ncbi:uncharacterized protein LOC126452256 [Schistocerca serialis cubense]|uniref:uncharacterized protein LOC126452256 n=1 Tax=Schistocerca serialis cubense TaxID=2023355 RepID=UPI00214F02CE|nr:uncharacterized protein LOC126452256 [Schistocerca serialis cubense]
MVRRLGPAHYVAPSPVHGQSVAHAHSHGRAASTDGEDSALGAARPPSAFSISGGHRPPSAISGTGRPPAGRSGTARPSPRAPSLLSDPEGSDIYVTSAAYRAPSEISRGSRYSRTPSRLSRPASELSRSTVKTSRTQQSRASRVSRRGGLVVETMAAPNPFCPNTRGMCCLMLLINLGLILVTLGFTVVIQFFEPLFVWILGIVFLVFGFATLFGSLVYCVYLCRDAKHPKDVNLEDLYWTHHWQKSVGTTDVRKSDPDRYSDRYSVGKYSDRY